MFIQTYLKFYQEYFKMVCSILKGSFSGIEFVKKLPIGPFSQIRSQIIIEFIDKDSVNRSQGYLGNACTSVENKTDLHCDAVTMPT